MNVTPLEPEWRGQVTIEISNTTPLPAKIYAGEGIAQILFLKAEERLPDQLRRQEGQVPGPDGADAAVRSPAASRDSSELLATVLTDFAHEPARL